MCIVHACSLFSISSEIELVITRTQLLFNFLMPAQEKALRKIVVRGNKCHKSVLNYFFWTPVFAGYIYMTVLLHSLTFLRPFHFVIPDPALFTYEVSVVINQINVVSLCSFVCGFTRVDDTVFNLF